MQLFNLGEQPESSTHAAAISPEQAMEAIEEIEENDTQKTAAASHDEEASATRIVESDFFSLSRGLVLKSNKQLIKNLTTEISMIVLQMRNVYWFRIVL